MKQQESVFIFFVSICGEASPLENQTSSPSDGMDISTFFG